MGRVKIGAPSFWLKLAQAPIIILRHYEKTSSWRVAAGETFKHFAGSPQSRTERAAQNQTTYVSDFKDSPLNALRISLWVGRCLNLTALSP